VLADIGRRGTNEIVCLGDVAAGGPQPREALERLRRLGCAVVRGNADDWLLGEMPAEADEDGRRLRAIVDLRDEAEPVEHEFDAAESAHDREALIQFPPTPVREARTRSSRARQDVSVTKRARVRRPAKFDRGARRSAAGRAARARRASRPAAGRSRESRFPSTASPD
jgi:hypothetical protein